MILNKILNKLISILIRLKLKVLYQNNVSIGKKTVFRRRLSVAIERSGKLKIGKKCFFNTCCSINCLGSIEIGNYSILGENVKMYDHNHRFLNPKVNIQDQDFKIGSIKIGNNCWIGSNVTILSNVVIGDNVVIGANCLIHKSIPSNTLVKFHNNLTVEEIY